MKHHGPCSSSALFRTREAPEVGVVPSRCPEVGLGSVRVLGCKDLSLKLIVK